MSIMLRDILISARQEAIQMRHFYLGVEHLFIALLRIRGGLASAILQEQGLTADYVIEAIRRKAGRGTTPQRLWVGIPSTPRAEAVLGTARNILLDTKPEEVGERELLYAIIVERDSLPIRVLKTLGVDFDQLSQAALTNHPLGEPQPPDILVTFGADFDRNLTIEGEQLFILRRMFADRSQVRIERRLTGFRKAALILVVTPIDVDGREEAPLVVKIDQAGNIIDEVQRYELHVKNALPLQTARLLDPPTAPEASDLAGIKYTLVASPGGIPLDLRTRVREDGVAGLGEFIKQELYARFSKTWWQERRPFRFQVWTEYDWLLPPILVLEFATNQEPPSNAHSLRIPFNRGKLKAKLKEFQIGDTMVLENFTVQKVDREANTLKLAVGYGTEADKRAYKIEVRGLNRLPNENFYRGEVVEQLVGTVWKTRHDLLEESVRDLNPDFDLRSRWIAVGEHRIFNPLLAYEDLLDRHVNGSLSKIHGDLHLGNILVGPNNTTWLIDFAHTRDGHALFDWATLEVSLLGDAVMPAVDASWDTARLVLQHLVAMKAGRPLPVHESKLAAVTEPIAAIQHIAQECLTHEGGWEEYHVALAMGALRATTWPTMPIGGRRLLFLLAGQSILELNRILSGAGNLETPHPDDADITANLPFVASESTPGLIDDSTPAGLPSHNVRQRSSVSVKSTPNLDQNAVQDNLNAPDAPTPAEGFPKEE